MSAKTFPWNGVPIAFRDGETIAAALANAGVRTLGRDPAGRVTRYFCGIGACQNCLVRVDGRVVEACLTPAVEGVPVESAGEPTEAAP